MLCRRNRFLGDTTARGLPWPQIRPIANQLYCAICNAFQYSRSIMTGLLKDNLKDLSDFQSDVSHGTLPAVSFIKPDTLLDSHPRTSTPPLFGGS